MKIKGIDHVGLIVPDLEKTVKFYTEVMGCALTGDITPWAGSPEECEAMQVPEGTQYRCAMITVPGGTDVQFMEFDKLEEPVPLNVKGAHYLSFMVDDMAAWVKHLTENGAKLMKEPMEYDEYGKTIQWCYVTDPNGVTFELIAES